MLQTTLSTPAPATFQPVLVRTITGRSIAKAGWGPRARARLAGEWKFGTVKVEPSIKLAAEVFGCSEQLVRQAVAELQHGAFRDGIEAAPLNLIESCWAGLNESARDEFVRRHLRSVWDAIDRVTG
jgi:hypothetical protein